MELTIYQRIILVTLSRMVWLLYKSVASDHTSSFEKYLYEVAKNGKIKDSFDNIIAKIG